jgi:hypothetical protein
MEQYEENKHPTCEICYDIIEVAEIYPLQQCGHLFHQECIQEYLQTEILDSKFPLKCPFIDCAHELSINEIYERVEEDFVEKFDNFTFNSYIQDHPEVSCCPTPD